MSTSGPVVEEISRSSLASSSSVIPFCEMRWELICRPPRLNPCWLWNENSGRMLGLWRRLDLVAELIEVLRTKQWSLPWKCHLVFLAGVTPSPNRSVHLGSLHMPLVGSIACPWPSLDWEKTCWRRPNSMRIFVFFFLGDFWLASSCINLDIVANSRASRRFIREHIFGNSQMEYEFLRAESNMQDWLTPSKQMESMVLQI